MTHQPGDIAGAALSADRRTRELAQLASRTEPLDVLVIGGGVTGAGVALDAASRGLTVAMVEAHDLAFGTSRWSSKLVHGGLRYLAGGNFALARESALERHRVMTTIAPHLVRPMGQLLPVFSQTPIVARVAARAGMLAGDVLRHNVKTPTDVLPRSRRISAGRAVELCPGIRTDGLRSAVLGHDGQLIDDARLVLAIARTAASWGAVVCTYTRASQVTGQGALLTDTRTGTSFPVAARSVVNATGVWAGQVDQSIRLRPSRGTHLVVDAGAVGNPTAALTVPIGGSISRFVFALPQQLGRVYIGLTDEDAPGEIPDEPVASETEINLLLNTINPALHRELTRADILGTYSGLRPLIDHGGEASGRSTADLSRNHLVQVNSSGVITVVGGKLTTYRQMAQDAVDEAVQRAGLRAQPCQTISLPLVGADRVPGDTGLPASLVARFGAEAEQVLESATIDDPSGRIADDIDVTRAEVQFALTHEGALTVDDVLARRTRIALVPSDAEAARPRVTEIVKAAAPAPM
jgi:glycerol-3-phosphate dehydrogenase